MKFFNLIFDFCCVSDYMHGRLELELVGCMEMKSLSSSTYVLQNSTLLIFVVFFKCCDFNFLDFNCILIMCAPQGSNVCTQPSSSLLLSFDVYIWSSWSLPSSNLWTWPFYFSLSSFDVVNMSFLDHHLLIQKTQLLFIWSCSISI
jgi:hypothetical protein